MKTKGFSDLVASDMLAKLASEDHLSLFHKNYVVAEDQTDELNAKDSSVEEEDCSMADDEDADDNDASDSDEDESDADDAEEDDVSNAMDAAVAHLVMACDKLDYIGFEKSASFTAKLASFVAEAKKKSDEKKSDKKKSDKKKKDSAKGKSGKSDSNDARAKKKKDSGKDSSKGKSSGKSDSGKSSGKSNPFAKKK